MFAEIRATLATVATALSVYGRVRNALSSRAKSRLAKSMYLLYIKGCEITISAKSILGELEYIDRTGAFDPCQIEEIMRMMTAQGARLTEFKEILQRLAPPLCVLDFKLASMIYLVVDEKDGFIRNMTHALSYGRLQTMDVLPSMQVLSKKFDRHMRGLLADSGRTYKERDYSGGDFEEKIGDWSLENMLETEIDGSVDLTVGMGSTDPSVLRNSLKEFLRIADAK